MNTGLLARRSPNYASLMQPAALPMSDNFFNLPLEHYIRVI